MAMRDKKMGGWEMNNPDRYMKILYCKSDTFGFDSRGEGGWVGVGVGCDGASHHDGLGRWMRGY